MEVDASGKRKIRFTPVTAKDTKEAMEQLIPFMENFLLKLYKCYKEQGQRFSVINGKRLKKNERIEQTVLNSVLPVSNKISRCLCS